MRAVFIKFGPLLPSLIKLAKMWINYWWGFELPKLLFPTFLTLALFTVPIIGCCIKHQLRSVKEVRYKMRLGNTPMGINICLSGLFVTITTSVCILENCSTVN